MKTPDTDETRELLNKCWMTHDGMWFYHCYRELGIEAANRLNKAAIASLAPIESKRIMKACDLGDIRCQKDLEEMILRGFRLVIADFMDFNWQFPKENVLRLGMGQNCFALNGMRRLGVEKEYECGIFHRVEGWFKALGLKYQAEPEVLNCMMLTRGECSRDYRFEF